MNTSGYDNDAVASNGEDRLPAGRQPYDGLVGLRVGAIAGGVVGAGAGLVMRTPWLLLPGAVIGGAVGFLTERAKVRDETRKLGSDGPDTEPPDD